jgi:hypothetical protein
VSLADQFAREVPGARGDVEHDAVSREAEIVTARRRQRESRPKVINLLTNS